MSYGTVIQSGSFTSTGNSRALELRSDVDVIQVYNYSIVAAGIAAAGYRYTWFRGMPANEAIVEGWVGGVTATVAASVGVGGGAVPGFTLVDSSVLTPAAAIAVAAGTNATQPVYNTAGTNLSNGDIVRIQNTDHTNLNGLDFTVDAVNAGVSFRLANAIQQAPGVVAGAAGTYRRIPYNPLYYPRARVIANITQAAAGVVTTLVDHGYTTGQSIRFTVPAECGMVELDGIQATVTVLSVSTFSINVNTTAFSAFTFPLAAVYPANFAQVKPIGEDSVVAPNVLADATLNTGYIGIQLGAGAYSPAGANGNVIYWVASKSVNL